jgi:hypothetical protein
VSGQPETDPIPPVTDTKDAAERVSDIKAEGSEIDDAREIQAKYLRAKSLSSGFVKT